MVDEFFENLRDDFLSNLCLFDTNISLRELLRQDAYDTFALFHKGFIADFSDEDEMSFREEVPRHQAMIEAEKRKQELDALQSHSSEKETDTFGKITSLALLLITAGGDWMQDDD